MREIVDKRHNEMIASQQSNAVSLTPDILKILEETREGAMEELEAVGDYNESKNTKEALLQVENEPFRVNSFQWNRVNLNGTVILYNDDFDIIEIAEGECIGEQLFSQEAALRETAKAGKRMPTIEEWGQIINNIVPGASKKEDYKDGGLIGKTLNMKMTGFFNKNAKTLYGLGREGFYCSSTERKAIRCTGDNILPQCPCSDNVFFTVKCIKEKGESEINKTIEKVRNMTLWDTRELAKIDAIKVIDDEHIQIAGFIHKVGTFNTPGVDHFATSYDNEGNSLYTYEYAQEIAKKAGYKMYTQSEMNKIIDALPGNKRGLSAIILRTLLDIPTNLGQNCRGNNVIFNKAEIWLKSKDGNLSYALDSDNNQNICLENQGKKDDCKYLLVHK